MMATSPHSPETKRNGAHRGLDIYHYNYLPFKYVIML